MTVITALHRGELSDTTLVPNELLDSLSTGGKYRYGLIDPTDQSRLIRFSRILAVEYQDAFELTNNPRNNTVSSVVAVMHRLNGKLSAITGVIVWT
uniref:Uncharacterized protein n=1 Tax=Ditylenchus dipsaci TaxID=166011 RepID=A0A915CZQ4_9BILA